MANERGARLSPSRGRAAAQAAAEEVPMAQGVQGVEAGSGGDSLGTLAEAAQGHRESGGAPGGESAAQRRLAAARSIHSGPDGASKDLSKWADKHTKPVIRSQTSPSCWPLGT